MQNHSTLQTPSNDIERSFYELHYSIQNIGRSTKGRYDMINPARALSEINEARDKLRNLEKICRADIRKRIKYAESMGLPIPYNAQVPADTMEVLVKTPIRQVA